MESTLQLTVETVLKVLGSALAIYILGLAVGRLLKKAHLELGFLYRLFCLSSALYLSFGFFVPGNWDNPLFYWPVLLTTPALLVALIDRYLWVGLFTDTGQQKVPKLLHQVTTLVIYLVPIALLLNIIYEGKLTGLLAGSGIVAIILGLAMQDLLGNVIAGLAIQAGKPFRIGDWLIVEDFHVQVMEVNWRSTRFRTLDHVFLDIPNNNLTKQTIVNLHYPTRRHAMRLQVGVEYGAGPNQVKDLLCAAARETPNVLMDPKPRAFLKDFGNSAIIYELRFWMDNHVYYNEVSSNIRTNIWYQLRRNGFRIPFPIRTLEWAPAKPDPVEEGKLRAREALGQQPIFMHLEPTVLDRVVESGEFHSYGRGEPIFEQGTDGDSMAVLLRGRARVVIDQQERQTEVAQIGEGDCVGEMALLTGEKRNASVIATTDCDVLDISKSVFCQLLEEQSEVMDQLCTLLAQRQVENEGLLAKALPENELAQKRREYRSGFLKTLRSVFGL